MVLLVGVVAGLAVGGAVSWASIPDTIHGQITGCYAVSGVNKGDFRIIDYQGGERCLPGEHILKWERDPLRWRGPWSASASYADNDGVLYNGAVYIAHVASVGVPPSDTTVWALILPKGVQGVAGPKGATGVAGAHGATGARGATGSVGPSGATGGSGPQGVPGQSSLLAAQPVDAVTGWSLTDSGWSDLSGAATTITVPAGTSALVVARWTGVINPDGPNVSGVMLRIVLDGTPMQPYAPPEGVNYGDNLSFERSLTGVGAGTHDVTVQASVPSCSGCSQAVDVSSSELVVEGSPQ